MGLHFTVVGDGAMGTACALLLAKRHGQHATIWCQFEENCRQMAADHENRRFLPGVAIPKEIGLTSDWSVASKADAFILAVPAVYLSATLEKIRSRWPADRPVVSVVKGLEQGTFRRPSQIVCDVVGNPPVVALSGPSHAEEIARGMPASVVAASDDQDLARQVQQWFSNERFRVYTSPDLLGTEVAGALKNVIAIAAGICDGLGFGDNAKSALMTRGLVEMARLGRSMGARSETFYGLQGLGDLITTCVSPHGRNRRVGERIGKGETLEAILADTRQVAEGVWTARSVHDHVQANGLDAPVSSEVYRILFEGKSPLQAVDDLMTRDLKPQGDVLG